MRMHIEAIEEKLFIFKGDDTIINLIFVMAHYLYYFVQVFYRAGFLHLNQTLNFTRSSSAQNYRGSKYS